MPLVGAMQNVASVPQFRPETAPGRVFVALWRDYSSDVKNGATGRRWGECGEPATKLATQPTGRPVLRSTGVSVGNRSWRVVSLRCHMLPRRVVGQRLQVGGVHFRWRKRPPMPAMKCPSFP